jgi:hypothetical protein
MLGQFGFFGIFGSMYWDFLVFWDKNSNFWVFFLGKFVRLLGFLGQQIPYFWDTWVTFGLGFLGIFGFFGSNFQIFGSSLGKFSEFWDIWVKVLVIFGLGLGLLGLVWVGISWDLGDQTQPQFPMHHLFFLNKDC